jgi:hypothetical protein
VAGTSVQIDGAGCPAVIHYTTYISDLGPPSEMYITSSKSDVRAAHASVIKP